MEELCEWEVTYLEGCDGYKFDDLDPEGGALLQFLGRSRDINVEILATNRWVGL